MGDFMAATAQEVLRRQLERFEKQVAEIPVDAPALEAALTVLRDLTANDTNAVLYELLIAARTDDRLRAVLAEVLAEYSAKIADAARALPTAEAFPEEHYPTLVALLTNTFDGAAIVRAVLPQPEIEANRIPLLLSLLGGRSLRVECRVVHRFLLIGVRQVDIRRRCGHRVVDEVGDLGDRTPRIGVDVEAELEHVQERSQTCTQFGTPAAVSASASTKVSLRSSSLSPICSRTGPSPRRSASGGITGSSRVPLTVANTR